MFERKRVYLTYLLLYLIPNMYMLYEVICNIFELHKFVPPKQYLFLLSGFFIAGCLLAIIFWFMDYYDGSDNVKILGTTKFSVFWLLLLVPLPLAAFHAASLGLSAVWLVIITSLGILRYVHNKEVNLYHYKYVAEQARKANMKPKEEVTLE